MVLMKAATHRCIQREDLLYELLVVSIQMQETLDLTVKHQPN